MAVTSEGVTRLDILSYLQHGSLIPQLESLYVQARQKKRQYYSQWRRNYLLLNNRMWADYRPQWMPSPTDSEMYPIVSTLISYMMDQGVSFSVAPAATPHTPFYTLMGKLANDLQTLLETNWEVENYYEPLEVALWDAAQTGAGILKTVWDGGLDQGLGNATICRVDPWSFYPDPNATNIKDSQYFIEYQRMSLDQIQRLYPLAYDAVRANLSQLEDGGAGPSDTPRPFVYDSAQYPMANLSALPGGTFQAPIPGHGGGGSYGLPGQSRLNAVDTQGVNVYECWVREIVVDDPPDTDPLSDLSQDAPLIYDRWRVVVHAAGVVLMDELAENLWEYSRHPYERLVFDDIGEFWGIALCTHLSSAQIAINRLLSSVQQNAEMTGNPILLKPTTSGISRQAILNRPGETYDVSGVGGSNQANEPHWMQPPAVPQYVIDLIQWWISRMENISSISALQKGSVPQGRATNKTVTATQDSGFVRIRNNLRHVEAALRNIGNMLAQLIIQNYTTHRTVAIVGPSGQNSALHLAARHFYAPYRDPKDNQRLLPLKYSILVTAGANNPTSRQSRIEEADLLFAMGAIDQQAVLEAHNYPNWQQIVQRVMQQQQALAQLGMQAPGAGAPGKRVRSKRKT